MEARMVGMDKKVGVGVRENGHLASPNEAL
jgi:hypothetical protein